MSRDWYVVQPVLPLFEEGKDLDVRVRNGYPERVPKGDVLFINGTYVREVVDVRRYSDFEEMLSVEDFRRINPRAKHSAEVLAALRQLYPVNLERKGVLVFELRKP